MGEKRAGRKVKAIGKSETRRPKSERNPKAEDRKTWVMEKVRAT
jgi:hypothetical protein